MILHPTISLIAKTVLDTLDFTLGKALTASWQTPLCRESDHGSLDKRVS
jgi:hypothetical protein